MHENTLKSEKLGTKKGPASHQNYYFSEPFSSFCLTHN